MVTGRFPSPDTIHPVRLADGTPHHGTVFLSAAIDHPRFFVGDYTYASARMAPDSWAEHLAPYLYPTSPEKLSLGKFCQIADGAQFITSSANHRYDGISSYPFAIFDGGMADARPSMPGPGPDTSIGHDVWIGQGAKIMPGAQIGSGVIVGTGFVVTGHVPDYCIVAGNPGRILRRRFSHAEVLQLLEIAWWDWPIDKIRALEAEICGADVKALART